MPDNREFVTWSCSIRPEPRSSFDTSRNILRWIACTLAVIDFTLFFKLALEVFAGAISYLVCSLIAVLFTGFIQQIFVYGEPKYLHYLLAGLSFVAGMMFFQLYF